MYLVKKFHRVVFVACLWKKQLFVVNVVFSTLLLDLSSGVVNNETQLQTLI